MNKHFEIPYSLLVSLLTGIPTFRLKEVSDALLKELREREEMMEGERHATFVFYEGVAKVKFNDSNGVVVVKVNESNKE